MRKRSIKSFTYQILSSNCGQFWIFTKFFSHILVSEVSCSSLTNNEILVIYHFIETIFSFWKNEAVSLTIHSFSSECSSNQKNVFSSIIIQRIWEFEQFDFNSNILLRSFSFTFTSVVISAWLIIKSGKYRVLLTIIDLSQFLKSFKLPSDERVIKWICLSCNERSSPINTDTKSLQIFFSFWWEKFKPMFGFLELWNFFICDSNLL